MRILATILCLFCLPARADDFSLLPETPISLVGDFPVDLVDGLLEDSRDEVLFFTAPWCGWCEFLKDTELPRLRESGWDISERLGSRIRIVDFDSNRELAESLGIDQLPAFTAGGRKLIGYHSANAIADWINDRPAPQKQEPKADDPGEWYRQHMSSQPHSMDSSWLSRLTYAELVELYNSTHNRSATKSQRRQFLIFNWSE
jgi:thiol-disulfide isomerase/thioredoxin